MLPTIRPARVDEIPAVLDLLMLAFSADPPVRYVWRTAEEYARWHRPFFMAMAGDAFSHGTAFVTDDLSAVALWRPPGAEADPEAVGNVVVRALPPERLVVPGQVGEAMGGFHPHEPHWYLPLLGVDPARQGQGLGSALLKHSLRICDAQGAPAYLESSNPKNVPLYERHGFEVTGRIQPGDFPGLTPMLRKARGAGVDADGAAG
jgi:ribosomal protein S18 acetylase RimI-like enzyme